MSMFDEFKRTVPDNSLLCKQAAEAVLGDSKPEFIKKHFSSLLDKMQEEIYRRYLAAQESAAQAVIDEAIRANGTITFGDLDKLFMSIFQSRKSRAGKAFEYVIKELFARLSYPFSDQVVIDGAKPDFVIPSEEHFRARPLDSIIFTAKRTLRERWRQVVTEANKGYGYFLATLDEKITRNQIEQAAEHKIFIIVPKSLKEKHDDYRGAYSVLSFEEFFERHLDPAMARWKLA